MRSSVLHILCAVAVLWHMAGVVSAQAPPTFEAASVKPNSLRTGIRGHSFPSDRFVATNVPLRDLIIIAYGAAGQPLPEPQLSGGPGWIDSDRFDVNAKVGSESPMSVPQKQLMLRTLLADRFRLVVHTETRNLPVYVLRLARRDGAFGPQLHRADVDCEALLASEPSPRERCLLFMLPSGKLMVRGQTMRALANGFTSLLERVVIDQTGLVGGFDADADFDPVGLPGMLQLNSDDANRPSNDLPSLFTALQDRLGLKLESTRGPVEILVIDGVDRPTPD